MGGRIMTGLSQEIPKIPEYGLVISHFQANIKSGKIPNSNKEMRAL